MPCIWNKQLKGPSCARSGEGPYCYRKKCNGEGREA